MNYNDLASIRDTALRCMRESVPLTECALRRLTHNGVLPACRLGRKTLLYWPNVLAYIERGNNTPDDHEQNGGIRPVKV